MNDIQINIYLIPPTCVKRKTVQILQNIVISAHSKKDKKYSFLKKLQVFAAHSAELT